MNITDGYLKNVANTWDGSDLSYSDRKKEAHRQAARVLRFFAREMLELGDSEFDVRSNMGGVAVSGEVTLHTDSIYIQIGQVSLGRGHSVLWRSCKGRRDYTGGHNRWGSVERLFGSKEAMARFGRAVIDVVALVVH